MSEQSFDYPDMAQIKGDEGMAYTTFTLNKEGKISRIQVTMAEPCKGCAEAAADVVSSMEGMWFPALMDGGKAVSTKMTVPVRFKLLDE